MHRVSIVPRWTVSDPNGESLSPRLLELLAQVAEHGSLSAACRARGGSYRHAWNLVRDAEQRMGAPLLHMERGRGSTLTPLGEKLVWAGRRIAARLTPLLESLASELESEIGRVLVADSDTLRVHASHGFAVEKLLDELATRGVALDRQYVGSPDAVVSLHGGMCDLAGFHLPVGAFEARARTYYARWVDPRVHRVINVATRRQGLMVAAGNPHKIYEVADLTRNGVRFVNRQRGSGTRFLLECLLDAAGIDPAAIVGFEHAEYTHAAIAAYVASGMADVGFGVETPARRFKLDFLPLATERYFLLCRADALERPALRETLAVLRSAAFHQVVDALPGYTPLHCGEVASIEAVFGEAIRAPRSMSLNPGARDRSPRVG